MVNEQTENPILDKLLKTFYYLGMIKKLNKLLSKLDFNRDSPWGDWEANIYDPEPLSVKFLLKALISYPLAVLYIAIAVTALYFLLLLLFS